MSDYQENKFSVVFDGTLLDLIAELESAGFDVRLHSPGIVDTLVIEKTPTQKVLDEAQDRNKD